MYKGQLECSIRYLYYKCNVFNQSYELDDDCVKRFINHTGILNCKSYKLPWIIHAIRFWNSVIPKFIPLYLCHFMLNFTISWTNICKQYFPLNSISQNRLLKYCYIDFVQLKHSHTEDSSIVLGIQNIQVFCADRDMYYSCHNVQPFVPFESINKHFKGWIYQL